MKTKSLLMSFFTGAVVVFSLPSLAEEIPYTLEDRDRLIRVETTLQEFKQTTEKRLERIDTVMLGGFGLLFTSLIGLVGFVLWDRRSALSPAIRKTQELEERGLKIERALKEIAQHDQSVAEALKHVGLL